jgi:hypothetical protein
MNTLVICQGPSYGTDARAATGDQLTAPAHRATLEDLTDRVLWADKTVAF